MKEFYNTIAFIAVRGGSKSIPLKNIKNMAGKPLVHWTIREATKAKHIDKVFVSTDSKKIRDCVNKLNSSKVVVIKRSRKTATDKASTESALIEFCKNKKYDFNNVFLIQATSPLLKASDLDLAYEKRIQTNSDSLLTVVRQIKFLWSEEGEPLNYDYTHRPRRQDFDGILTENGSFYISNKRNILKHKCRLSGKICLYEMSEENYYDIDELSDWIVVEELLKNRIKLDKVFRL